MPSTNGIVFFKSAGENGMAFLLGYGTQTKMTCHLIGSDMTMNHLTTLAQLQAAEIPAGSGYAPLDMPLRNGSPDWDLTEIPAGGKGVYRTISWLLTAQRTIYGYWFNDYTDNRSFCGEMFSVAFLMGAGGGTFLMQPSLTLTSQP